MGLRENRIASHRIALVLGSFLFCVATTPAHGLSDSDFPSQVSEKSRGFTVRKSGDWTYYERSAVDLSSAKWKVESFAGRRTTGGACSTVISVWRPPNARPLEGVEVAFNSVTCESRMASASSVILSELVAWMSAI